MTKRKPPVTTKCAWCAAPFTIPQSKLNSRNYCSRRCYADAQSKAKNPDGYKEITDYSAQSRNMTRINLELNPTRMTPEVRAKLREARKGTGNGKAYEKTFGRHTHRLVAEQKIGRKLKPGEIVHHIDGDIHNNSPENLEVMTQREHIELHRKQGDLAR